MYGGSSLSRARILAMTALPTYVVGLARLRRRSDSRARPAFHWLTTVAVQCRSGAADVMLCLRKLSLSLAHTLTASSQHQMLGAYGL